MSGEESRPSAPSAPSDLWGRDLDIVIRVARDGRIYFHDIPLDMIPVVRTLCPDHPDLARRAAIAATMLRRLDDPAIPTPGHASALPAPSSPDHRT